jgi:uncharacterized repeat protein (TIGR01451 family)
MLTLNMSAVSHNMATSNGGGIYNSLGIVTLNSSIVISNTANGDYGGGGIFNDDELTLMNSIVSENITTAPLSNGGGIFNNDNATLAVKISNISNNLATSNGGGIYNNGSATLANSTVSENVTTFEGGGIFIFTSGALTLSNSTISANIAGSVGGGLRNFGTLVLTNSTFSGNTATVDGGGLYNSNGTLNLNNVTLTSNTADNDTDGSGDGGGIYISSGTVNFKNTVIAGNIDTGGQAPDCSGILNSLDYNLIQSTTGCTITGTTTNNVTGLGPSLSPLQNNGGSTLTHALLPNSPAIDMGNPAGCTDNAGNLLTTDQRSYSRSVDGDGNSSAICDIGAYEYGSFPVVDISVTKAVSPDPVLIGQPLVYIVTVTNTTLLTATGVVVTDTLPMSVTFGSAASSQGTCSGTSTVICNLGSITSGISVTVTLVVSPTAAGVITNIVAATGNQFDTAMANNSDSKATTVVLHKLYLPLIMRVP